MANEPVGAVSAGQPQPVQNGQGPQGQGENPAATTPAPAPLTLEQVQEVFSSMLEQREQRTSRALQSQLDKRDANILKRIADVKQQGSRWAETAKKSGIEAGQAQAMAQNYVNAELDAILEEQRAAEQQAQQQQSQQQQQPDEAAQVMAYAESLVTTLGLSEDDPELLEAYQAMKKARSSEEYIGFIRDAYRNKVKRELGGSGTEPRQASPARMPGLGAEGGQRASTNPIKDINNAAQLYKLASQQQR